MSSPQITKRLFKLKKIVDKQKSASNPEITGTNDAIDKLIGSFNLEGSEWPQDQMETGTGLGQNMLSQ